MSTAGTGLDVRGIVRQLMQIESRPLNTLEKRKSDLGVRTAVLTDLGGKLDALRDEARTLTDPLVDPFGAKTVTSSLATVATATAGSTAVAQQHSLFVTQLARSHTMVSDQVTSAGTEISAALGAGDQTFSVTVDGVATPVTVTIGAGETNETVLQNMVTAINFAFVSVTDKISASLVEDTSTTSKLVLTSTETGLDYKMTLADTSGTLLSQIGIDNEAVAATGATGGYIYADSVLDAQFTLDGIDIVRSKNAVDDVLTGVTLNLVDAQDGGDSAITLTIAADVESVKTTIQDFLDDFNSALTYLRAKTVTNESERGPLADDFTYRNLALSMRTDATSSVTGVSAGSVEILSQIGITSAADGTLSISEVSDLEDAIAADPAGISDLFRLTDGVAQRIEDLLDPFVNADGFLDRNKSSIQSQAVTVDESIERMQERLDSREAYLMDQYTRLSQVINQFQAQMNLIRQIQSYLSINQ